MVVLKRFLPPRDAGDSELAHQPSDAFAADPHTVLVGQLGVDPWRPVGLQRAVVDHDDPPLQLRIAQ